MGALVLTRKAMESIEIGKAGVTLTRPVKVTFVAFRSGQATITIDAQSSVGIFRTELLVDLGAIPPKAGDA